MRIKGMNGKFIAAEQGGGLDGFERPDALICNRDTAGEWEEFRLEAVGDRVGIRTATGNAITAEDGGGGPLSTNRTNIDAWEQFIIRDGLIICANNPTFCWAVDEQGHVTAKGRTPNNLVFGFEEDQTPIPIPINNPGRLQGGFCIPTP